MSAFFHSFVRYVVNRYFLPAYGMPFHSLNSVYGILEILNFDKTLLVNFFSTEHDFNVISKNLCLIQGYKVFPLFFSSFTFYI